MNAMPTSARWPIIAMMNSSLLAVRMLLAVAVEAGVVLIGLVVALSFAALLLVRRRRQARPRPGSWRAQLRLVCEEAGAAVDGLLPQRSAVELPSTSALTAIAAHLRSLDGPLARLVHEAPSRASEAAEDIGRVSVTLRSALQAERSSRLTIDHGDSARRAASTRLVIERAIELEMAVQAALWLIDEDQPH